MRDVKHEAPYLGDIGVHCKLLRHSASPIGKVYLTSAHSWVTAYFNALSKGRSHSAYHAYTMAHAAWEAYLGFGIGKNHANTASVSK